MIYNGVPDGGKPAIPGADAASAGNAPSVANTASVAATPSLIWFSQTIGPGRGLETLLEALKETSIPVELHLIGECVPGYDQELEKAFPKANGHRLLIHPPVRHALLPTTIAGHRIGLAIELRHPESRNKTITNKILQYLQAGVQVLATATDGQQEVAVHFPGNIGLVPPDDPAAWAASLESLLQTEPDRETTRHTFDRLFSWEAQEKKLLTLVANALN